MRVEHTEEKRRVARRLRKREGAAVGFAALETQDKPHATGHEVGAG